MVDRAQQRLNSDLLLYVILREHLSLEDLKLVNSTFRWNRVRMSAAAEVLWQTVPRLTAKAHRIKRAIRTKLRRP